MWIELHDGARDHPKILKLARDLKIEEPHALGHIAALWLWCLRMAPDGNLESFEVEDIEIAAKWDGEPGAFYNALIKRKLLDELPAGGVACHDWLDYAGSLKAAYRMRDLRERKRNAEQSRNGDVTVPNGDVMLRRPTDRTDRKEPKKGGAKVTSKGSADSSTSEKSPPSSEEFRTILKIWSETGEHISGQKLPLDEETHREYAEKILKLCSAIDAGAPYAVASERMQRYWREKYTNGKKLPALRFFVEDFSEHPAPAPAGSRAMTRDEVEEAIVRAQANKEYERSQLETARIFKEVEKEKEARRKMAGWDRHINDLRQRL